MSVTYRKPVNVCLIILILFSTCILKAQSFKEQKRNGIELLNAGNAYEAIGFLAEAYRLKQDDPEVLMALAKANLETNNTGESLVFIEILEKANFSDKAGLVLLKAKIKHLQHDFLSALRLYKSYLSLKSSDENLHAFVKDQIMRCATGIKLSRMIHAGIVDNLGEAVNSEYDEFAPVLSPNYSSKLYFSSSNPKCNGGKRNAEGLSDRLGQYCSDIYAAYLINGSWTNTEALSYLINGPRNEAIYGFTEKGKQMYFFRGFSMFSGEILVDTFQKNIDQVINPHYFECPIETDKGDRDLYFVNDTVIIFSSNRSGGYGGFDLYISKRRNNIWTLPLNMGPEVNSAYNEVTPFLSQDGLRLYFSSDGLNSIGGFDIFSSTLNRTLKKWSIPVNQGIPLNSAGDDMYFTLSNEGYYGYFASSRLESLGERDIFSVYYSDPVQNIAESDVSATIPPGTESKVIADSDTKMTEKENLVEMVGTEGENTIETASLYYEDEYNLLTEKNIGILDKLAPVLSENPVLKLVVTCHSANRENPKVEAYLTIKRAEQIKDYLLKKGVNEQQIMLWGVGSNFPMIKEHITSKSKSIENTQLNRVDFHFVNEREAGLKFVYNLSNVSKALISDTYSQFRSADFGLNYRVQITASSQLNSSAILDKFPDFIIEKRPSNELLFYLTGNSAHYVEITEVKNNINSMGIKDAFIVPYIDGWPITKSQAYLLRSKYPDLNLYIAGGK